MNQSLREIMDVPLRDRVPLLSRAGRIFHIILAQQFDRPFIDEICMLAEMICQIHSTRKGTRLARGPPRSPHRAL